MSTKIMLNTAEDLREFMDIAFQCASDIGVHTRNGQIADAKSMLGLIALDYSEPVTVVTEDESFQQMLSKWIVNG